MMNDNNNDTDDDNNNDDDFINDNLYFTNKVQDQGHRQKTGKIEKCKRYG